jgi:dihydroorotase
MPETITLDKLFDAHIHLRTTPILEQVLLFTVRCASRGIIMPNLKPRAILYAADITWYYDIICRALDAIPNGNYFMPLITIAIRDRTTPQNVAAARKIGAVAGKIYPIGVTTNSDEGLHDFFSTGILETFRAMQDVGMPALFHGELAGEQVLVTKREKFFLPTFVKLAEMFPNLKMVLEHVSSRDGVEVVKRLGPNVAATITPHHLMLTLNDVIGDGIRPHNCCMPTPKDFDDRDALIAAATSGNPKFFLGSDSAPHLRENKECAKGACGVYNAPVLAQTLVQIFERAGRLDMLDNFCSRFGMEFYGLRGNAGQITLIKEKWRVPAQCGSIVPFLAGTELNYRFVSQT